MKFVISTRRGGKHAVTDRHRPSHTPAPNSEFRELSSASIKCDEICGWSSRWQCDSRREKESYFKIFAIMKVKNAVREGDLDSLRPHPLCTSREER